MAKTSRSEVEQLLNAYGSSGYVSELRNTVYQTAEGKRELAKQKLLFETRDTLKKKLEEHGVVIQWIQLYEFNTNRIRVRINYGDKNTLKTNFNEIQCDIYDKSNVYIRLTGIDSSKPDKYEPKGFCNVMIKCS